MMSQKTNTTPFQEHKQGMHLHTVLKPPQKSPMILNVEMDGLDVVLTLFPCRDRTWGFHFSTKIERTAIFLDTSRHVWLHNMDVSFIFSHKFIAVCFALWL